MGQSRRVGLGVVVLAVLSLAGCDSQRHGGSGEGSQAEQARVRRTPPQVEAECSGECRRALPSIGTLLRLALQSLRYDNNEILILNRRGEPVNLDGWIASTGGVDVALPAGITVPQNGLLRLHLARAGTSGGTDVYLPELSLGPSGEFALFTGTEKSAQTIALYNRWGTDPEGETYMPLAYAAEFWPQRGYVPVCAGYPGFVAVGDVGLPRGFKTMPERCFDDSVQNPHGAPQ